MVTELHAKSTEIMYKKQRKKLRREKGKSIWD